MGDEIRCENCKHYYSFFQESKDEKGMPDFVTVPRCRLDHEILPGGIPADCDCFEPRR